MNSTNIGVIATSENVDIATQALSECLKATGKFSETVYYNICNGQTYSVANGFWDFALYFVVIGIGVAFFSMVIKMLFY